MNKPTIAQPDVADAIRKFNTGREPERLAMKYAKMAQSPFVFLRGAAHLFYDSLPDVDLFRDAPLGWSCGDLHFENFGSYKGDNRLVYFDINDFDEAALAPITWDLVRLLTSIQCGADALNATHAEALAAGEACLAAYRGALAEGKPLWVEQETSTGLVNDLLCGLKDRERGDFLNRRTVRKGHRRSLIVDGSKALSASTAQRQTITEFMDRFAARQDNPKFFEVLDVARRIAGTGSLGVERYVALVEGKGSPDGNYLIDIKEANPSALVPRLARLGVAQPAWPDEATRVVTVQKRMQAVNHAFLQPAVLAGKPFIVKALQPSEDRVAIGDWGRKIDRLKEVVSTMGRLLAWDQLRASGRAGAANADALIAYAQRDTWVAPILAMAEITLAQWKAYSAAYKANGGMLP